MAQTATAEGASLSQALPRTLPVEIRGEKYPAHNIASKRVTLWTVMELEDVRRTWSSLLAEGENTAKDYATMLYGFVALLVPDLPEAVRNDLFEDEILEVLYQTGYWSRTKPDTEAAERTDPPAESATGGTPSASSPASTPETA